MKPSGVPWLGDIPAEWRIERIKGVADVIGERAESSTRYIGLENIESGSGRFLATQATVTEGSAIAFKPNDVLFGKLRPYLAKCHLAEWEGCCSSEFLVLRATKCYPRFLQYSLLSPTFLDYVNMSTYGTKMPRANWEIVGGACITLPPLPEQRAIATFLDEKCAAIDAFADEAKAGLAEYADWKRSIIFHAVTKGIPEDAAQPGGRPSPVADTARGDARPPMKDSGVEWIGKCPVSWKILPLKALCEMESGKTLSSEQILSAGPYPVYGANGLRGFYTDWNTVGPILLVGRQGALCGNVHKAQGRFWATEHALRTRPKDGIELGFLFYLLTGMNLNQYISQTAAQPGLAASTLLNVRTLLPSLPEQRAITAWLDEKCAAIDALVEEKKKLIEDLRTYKKSLIYETVTGKMRVAK